MSAVLVVYSTTGAPQWRPFHITSASAIDELNPLFAAGWYIPYSGSTPQDYLVFPMQGPASAGTASAGTAAAEGAGYMVMLGRCEAHRQVALLLARDTRGYYDLASLPEALEVDGGLWRPRILVTLAGESGIVVAEREEVGT